MVISEEDSGTLTESQKGIKMSGTKFGITDLVSKDKDNKADDSLQSKKNQEHTKEQKTIIKESDTLKSDCEPENLSSKAKSSLNTTKTEDNKNTHKVKSTDNNSVQKKDITVNTSPNHVSRPSFLITDILSDRHPVRFRSRSPLSPHKPEVLRSNSGNAISLSREGFLDSPDSERWKDDEDDELNIENDSDEEEDCKKGKIDTVSWISQFQNL